MSTPRWDRLLETCYQRGTDLLFISGSPPLIRTGDGWRSCEIAPLSLDDVRRLANELFEDNSPGGEDGFASCTFAYGDVCQFRAMAFAYPDTKSLLVSQVPADSLPSGANKRF